MEDFLAPLDTLTSKDLKLENLDSKIPIPSPEYLREVAVRAKDNPKKNKLTKHGEAYSAFCKWAALPSDLRNPSQEQEFEKKWALPKNYCAIFFRNREDFQEKRLKHFWNWFMDKFPDVVYHMVRRASHNSSSDAKALLEFASKKLDLEKTQVNITPISVVNLSPELQQRMDKLFIPQGYEEVKDITPETD